MSRFLVKSIAAFSRYTILALNNPISIVVTRKYPLRRYILGVLTHTTALERLWGGDGTLTMWF